MWSCSQAALVGTQDPAAIFAVMVVFRKDRCRCVCRVLRARLAQASLVFGPDQSGLLAAGATSPQNIHHATGCNKLRGCIWRPGPGLFVR
jgi:hypothetical protein